MSERQGFAESRPPDPAERLTAALKKAKIEQELLLKTFSGGTARLALDGTLHILSASAGYYRMIGYTEQESNAPPISGQAIRFVLPEDRPRVEAAVRGILQTNQPLSVSYRIRKGDGAIAWNTACCAGVERDGDVPFADVIFIDTTGAHQTEMQLESLINNIPAGVARAAIGEEIIVRYANQEFYRQIGYSPKEFAGEPLQNRYLPIVHPADRKRLSVMARNYMRSGERECTAIEFRVVSRRGETRWMSARASRLTDPTEPEWVVQAILTDITEERAQKKVIALNEERYRILSEQTRDTLFDWDIQRDHIQFSSNYKKMFGFCPPEQLPVTALTKSDIIYEEDKPLVQRMIEEVLDGAPYVSAEYRAKCADGSYIWCRNRVTAIYDDDHQPIHAIGLLTDINDLKRENSALQQRAMRDSLTGLLNRMAMQEQVERQIADSQSTVCAFLLLDVDCFKEINDQYGHAAGDAVLCWLSALLTGQFRGEDFIGRMGGDEFAVFLVGVPSAEAVYRKAKRLQQTAYLDSQAADLYGTVSISIGAALYPQHGRTFQELYQRADDALYRVKRAGGNGCALSAADF